MSEAVNETEKFLVSSSPHLHSGASVRKIMLDVLIALVPASVAGVVFFGWRAAALMAVCVAVAVGTEYACRKLMRRDNTIGDLSAAVTGLLLALNLPPSLPFWQAALGSIFAIAIAKQIFGGIGYNPFNPALIARAFLLISFTGAMTTWSVSHWAQDGMRMENGEWRMENSTTIIQKAEVDALATATPLGASKWRFKLASENAEITMQNAEMDATASATHYVPPAETAPPPKVDATASATHYVPTPSVAEVVDVADVGDVDKTPNSSLLTPNSPLPWQWTPKVLWRLFIGDMNGSLGETSALALLLGGVYLLIRKVIKWYIPVAYLGTVALFAGVMQLVVPSISLPVSVHLLTGGLMLGAWFMATDPVTSPITRNGMLIFGVGCGILTMVFRVVPTGVYPEGVSFAILIMNAFTPLINKACKIKKFGKR